MLPPIRQEPRHVTMPRAIGSLVLALLVGACGSATTTPAPPAATDSAATAASPTQAPITDPPTIAATDAAPSGSTLELLAERVAWENDGLALGGLLWKPAGPGPFPAVIWNHGSEKLPGAAQSNPLAAAALMSRGYVVLMPMRRGQGFAEGTWIVDATNAVPAAERPKLVTELHKTQQLSDQFVGLAYLRGLPYVDGARVAVAGWSYGGIQTVLGAGNPSAGYVAAVVFAPASQSWKDNGDLQTALLDAAKAATIPFLFVQAENDYSLVPTQALTDAIVADGGKATRSIYPAFGATAQDGHEFAVRGSDIWGTEVFAFLAAAFGE
jgi:carboxymethylenebutenolidase